MKAFLLLLLLIPFSAVTTAATLASWDFTNTGSSSAVPDPALFPYAPQGTLDSNMASASVSISPAAQGSVRGGGFWNDTFSAINWHTSTTLADAITSDRYFTISLTANPGASFSLTQLDVVLSSQSNHAVDFAILADTDENGWDTGDLLTGGSGTAQNSSATNASMTLSGSFFTDMTSAEFRVYGFGGRVGSPSSPEDAARLAIGLLSDNTPSNDVLIQGVAIPEPSTLVLFGIAISAIVVFRKRH